MRDIYIASTFRAGDVGGILTLFRPLEPKIWDISIASTFGAGDSSFASTSRGADVENFHCFDFWRGCKVFPITKTLPPKNKKILIKKNLIFFSYFCSKHRLWVLVRATLTRRF